MSGRLVPRRPEWSRSRQTAFPESRSLRHRESGKVGRRRSPTAPPQSRRAGFHKSQPLKPCDFVKACSPAFQSTQAGFPDSRSLRNREIGNVWPAASQSGQTGFPKSQSLYRWEFGKGWPSAFEGPARGRHLLARPAPAAAGRSGVAHRPGAHPPVPGQLLRGGTVRCVLRPRAGRCSAPAVCARAGRGTLGAVTLRARKVRARGDAGPPSPRSPTRGSARRTEGACGLRPDHSRRWGPGARLARGVLDVRARGPVGVPGTSRLGDLVQDQHRPQALPPRPETRGRRRPLPVGPTTG